MKRSVSNKVYADGQDGGAPGVVAKIPANDDAAVQSAAENGDVDPDDTPTELVPTGGGGGGGSGGGSGGGGGGGRGVRVPVTIGVTMLGIAYDEAVSQRAGYLKKMEPDEQRPLADSDGGTVIRLLYYLTYTEEGRTLLLNHPIDDAAGQTRAALRVALKKALPALESDRLEIALDAHFAAGAFVAALDKQEIDRMSQQQDIYKQRLVAILGALYDDAMGRDFSCFW